ncbi:MAG: hypothetical protein R3A49_00705 [Acidimicrobiia bacterium]
MGFMDKVKETASQVSDKSKELADKGKDKVDDTKAKRRIKELEGEIGRLVYDQRTGSADDDVETHIAARITEITELRDGLGDGDGEDSDDSGSDDA